MIAGFAGALLQQQGAAQMAEYNRHIVAEHRKYIIAMMPRYEAKSNIPKVTRK